MNYSFVAVYCVIYVFRAVIFLWDYQFHVSDSSTIFRSSESRLSFFFLALYQRKLLITFVN